MRYVPIGCLREGMVLGKSLYGANNELLLAQGQRIIGKYIDIIQNLGYQGIYISDSLSQDIEIINVIKDELRQKTTTTVKNVFMYANAGDRKSLDKTFEDSRVLVGEMVDEILGNNTLMVNMVDLKVFNDYTYYHSVNVAVIAVVLGIAMNYSYQALIRLGLGALLHDIGKVFVPLGVLDKDGKLTDEEFNYILQHPKNGYDYLMHNCILPSEAYSAVLQHHERFNGSGYPYGLKGSRISKNSKIIAVADVYDAMISNRPYRKALPPSEVMEYIVGGSTTLFDPSVVKSFVRKIAPYPVGTIVELTNGEKAIVTQNYENFGMRPKVRILNSHNANTVVSLKDDLSYLNVTIKGICQDETDIIQ